MQLFVASQNNGVWDTAIYVPGLPALNAGGNAAVGQVSCSSAGNCAAGGPARTPGDQREVAVMHLTQASLP